MMGAILAGGMFVAAITAVMAGFPVAFTLAGIGTLTAFLGSALGVFDIAIMNSLAPRYFGIMMTEVFVAVPLFIFMGITLEKSRIAEELLTTLGRAFGQVSGGLGYAVIIVGALLAASSGIVGATVVTMGLLSLPAMMRAGYDPRLGTGIICASGTLGQVIPPSTVLIFVADLLQSANQRAQMALGNYAPEPVSVGQLFAGTFLPGMLLVVLYLLWTFIVSRIWPQRCPPLVDGDSDRVTVVELATALAPPLILIVCVLGSILAGIATPTESASVGAIGALLLAFARRQMDTARLKEVMRSTLVVTTMVFIIFLGASLFSVVFRGLGGDELVAELLQGLPGGRIAALAAVLAVMFLLGFFLDTLEIIFIVVPITAPALIMLGVDPIWLGVLIGLNLQTSFLTPPFGFALFYLRGVAPPEIPTRAIYAGVMPFVALQILALVLVAAVPATATYLPNLLYGSTAVGEGMAPAEGIPAAPRPSEQGGQDLNELFR